MPRVVLVLVAVARVFTRLGRVDLEYLRLLGETRHHGVRDGQLAEAAGERDELGRFEVRAGNEHDLALDERGLDRRDVVGLGAADVDAVDDRAGRTAERHDLDRHGPLLQMSLQRSHTVVGTKPARIKTAKILQPRHRPNTDSRSAATVITPTAT